METSTAFLNQIQVYIEDTDAGGIVYHPNYLKYFERSRTEFLRALGFEKSKLINDLDVLFVITGADLKYHKPAYLDDVLEVKTWVAKSSGARLSFAQEIYRSNICLVSAKIDVACVNTAHKPVRLPKEIVCEMAGYLTQPAAA